MAHALAWNLNRGQRNVRLFEIGRAYALKDGARRRRASSTIGATGLAREKGVAETPREYEFADLKGDLDQIGELAGGFEWSPIGAALATSRTRRRISLRPQAASRATPARRASLSQRVADRFKLRQDVFLAEMALDPFYANYRIARAARKYRPISRFPAVERDFALVLADGTTFAAVRETISSLSITEIASIEAVDLYRGKNVPAGQVLASGARHIPKPGRHADRGAGQRFLNQDFGGPRTEAWRGAPHVVDFLAALAPCRPVAHNSALYPAWRMARPWERIVAQNMKVEIYGQSYSVVGDLEPDYAEELARYVDGTMREIARATGIVDSVKVAVLSALAIADELHTLRNTRMEGTDDLRERAERCISLIEKALEQST